MKTFIAWLMLVSVVCGQHLFEPTGRYAQTKQTKQPAPVKVDPYKHLYCIRFTASWCGPCQRFERIEEPNVKLPLQVIDIDSAVGQTAKRQSNVSSIPVIMICDRRTRKVLKRLTDYHTAEQVNAAIDEAAGLIETKQVQPATCGQDLGCICGANCTCNNCGCEKRGVSRQQVQVQTRLPVVNTPWGRQDLQTYEQSHGSCNCPMCQGIRGIIQSYRYQPMSITIQPEPQPEKAPVEPSDDVDFGQEPCPDAVIQQVVETLHLSGDDVFCDLGCGDGRILIAVAERYGCRAVGVEIDPAKAHEARRLVADSGLADRITIITGDALEFDPRDHGVTAVCAYLYPELLAKLAGTMRAVRIAVSPFHAVPGLEMEQVADLWVKT